ncbi:unnamed protein product [Symbiodinium pilosum]|uniref:Uncharacterized protein n=1 Tax=Symbiodinium pilosum TaxID=2952 RepID=A0A812XNZ3_SYMPI|nr:unnamed protein product [Symbiodinium pilosum]
MWIAKLDNTLRRMCTPSGRTGKLEVSAEVRAQWLKGGTPRKNLMDILVKFNGDKAAFKKRVEHIRTMARSKDLTIESGWYTKLTMKTILGWDKDTIKGAIAYCSAKERCQTHMRRCKYNRKVWEYWVDVKTHGTFKATESEMIEDKTSVEGQAESFMLGLEPGQPSDPYGQPSDDENSAELSDSDMEAGSSKGGGKGGKGAGKNKGYASKRAVENVAEVLANILRTKFRLENTMEKLREIRNEESTSCFG